MSRLRLILKCVFAVFFVVAGINHFVNPAFFLKIMPPYLPWHLPLVYISGVLEIVLGGLLLWPSWSRLAAWGLIALLIAVFPANLHMALHTDQHADHLAPSSCGCGCRCRGLHRLGVLAYGARR